MLVCASMTIHNKNEAIFEQPVSSTPMEDCTYLTPQQALLLVRSGRLFLQCLSEGTVRLLAIRMYKRPVIALEMISIKLIICNSKCWILRLSGTPDFQALHNYAPTLRFLSANTGPRFYILRIFQHLWLAQELISSCVEWNRRIFQIPGVRAHFKYVLTLQLSALPV